MKAAAFVSLLSYRSPNRHHRSTSTIRSRHRHRLHHSWYSKYESYSTAKVVGQRTKHPLALRLLSERNESPTALTSESLNCDPSTLNKDTLNGSTQSTTNRDPDRTTTTTTTTMRTSPLSNRNSVDTVSVVLLNLVAVLWGSQHAVIKSVMLGVSDINSTGNNNAAGLPAVFTLLRFGIAALLASPYLPSLFQNNPLVVADSSSNNTKPLDKEQKPPRPEQLDPTWRWGLEMGLWMFLGFGLQAVGLQYTTAQRSGFLLYLNVKFVPFLARILLNREITRATWFSALVAFSGTALLLYGSDDGASAAALNIGDLWTVAAAAASAMFILRLEAASGETTNAAALNAACLVTVTGLSAVWAFATTVLFSNKNSAVDISTTTLLWSQVSNLATEHPFELIYLGAVTTALANWIQTYAQRNVSAERASVIYAMDPVYGAGFSYLLLGETLHGPRAWAGAALITAAAATNAFLDVSKKPPSGETRGGHYETALVTTERSSNSLLNSGEQDDGPM